SRLTWPCSPLTDSHHTRSASTQKSLVSRDDVKISVSAPVASISTPKGVHLALAGGAWSHPLGMPPSQSVRVFPPTAGVALLDLGLGVQGDLQGLGVVLDLLAHRGDVGEDGVGVLGLAQRLGLLDALESVAHAVEDVAQRPLAGQVLLGVAHPGLQLLAQLLGGQVGVAALGLQLGVGLGEGLGEGADVPCPLGVLLLPAGPAACGEVLHAADALTQLVQALGDGVAAPAEAAFGLAGVALAQPKSNLTQE